MSTVHAFDILLEIQAPCTPDMSVAFLHYVYNDSMGHHAERTPPRDPRVTIRGLDQGASLVRYGCCPEVSFPTDYAPPNSDFPNEPAPSDENFKEAKRYRLARISEPTHPMSIGELKTALHQHGPTILIGAFPRHVVTVVGYDDSRRMIKYVDSSPPGVRERGYDYFEQRFAERQGTIRWLQVRPVSEPERFTGRIQVKHLIGRRFLTVKMGVEGQEPLVIWDCPGRAQSRDRVKDLTIDLPLPDYAKEFWPPTAQSCWYLEVSDDSPPGSPRVTGWVEDCVLLERQFSDDGECKVEQYRTATRHVSLGRGTAWRIYVPVRKPKRVR